MSFACIHIPNFLLQAAIRGNESLCDQAVAIIDGTFPLLTVVALSPKALQSGLHLGMTKAQAELFNIKLLHRSVAQEATAHQALLDCALAISPRVEDTHVPPLKGHGDTVVLDLAGLKRLHKSPEKIARKIKRLAQQLNLEVNIAVAANIEAAVIAARGFSGTTLIPPGREAGVLGPLPIEILPLTPELQETLKTWGIHTLQALSALPELGLVKRLGQEGKRLQELARGAYQRILVPIEPELKFEENMDLETPLELLEPLTFILSRLLKQLCCRLLARSLATNELRLILELETPSPVISSDTRLSSPAIGDPTTVPPCTRGDHRGVFNSLTPIGEEGSAKRRVREGPPYTVQESIGEATAEQSTLCHSAVLNLPLPTLDNKVLLKLLQLDLESHPPSAPIRSVFLKAEATSPRRTQQELFVPSGPEPEKLEITLARIGAIVGRNRVGSPTLLNTHKPDSFELRKFLPQTTTNMSRKFVENHSSQGGDAQPNADNVQPQRMPRSSLRRFRPPITVRVETKSGVPVRIVFDNNRRKVLEYSGPWRINGDWWTNTQWTREEWDVTLQQRCNPTAQARAFKVISAPETAVYRIYLDLRTQQWFVEGMYD